MKDIISKELLSEVLCDNKIIGCAFTSELGFDAVEYVWIGCRAIDDCEEFVDHINIYELAHKCKEWANKCGINGKNYQLVSSVFPESLGGGYCEVWSGACKQTDDDFVANSEQIAIFKACQWILDNKDK